jgi:hypothetical protein
MDTHSTEYHSFCFSVNCRPPPPRNILLVYIDIAILAMVAVVGAYSNHSKRTWSTDPECIMDPVPLGQKIPDPDPQHCLLLQYTLDP